jgi:MAPEG family protein
MTLELKMLGLSIVLGLAQIVLASHAASHQRGYVWTASARDAAVPALTGLAGRLDRALRNFIETFPLFAAGVERSDARNHFDSFGSDFGMTALAKAEVPSTEVV